MAQEPIFTTAGFGTSGGGGVSANFVNGTVSTLTIGQLCYFDGTGALEVALSSAADATLAPANLAGVVADETILAAATGAFALGGLVTVRMEAGLALTPGDTLYLSASTPGSATNVAPSGAGQLRWDLGTIADLLTYDGATDFLVSAVLQPGTKFTI